MKRVKWDNKNGVVDAETGLPLLQLVTVNCSKKYRNTAGKELVNKLNTIAQSEQRAVMKPPR